MEYYIYLLQIFGAGNPRINQIIETYGTAEKAAKAILTGDFSQVPSNRADNAKNATLDYSFRVISYCKKRKLQIITIDDSRYPVMLKNIFNPPVVLFVDGDISCLDNRLSISVVGPRKPDNYAVRLATNICGMLAGCKIALVSGFAYGIDSIAHIEALNRKTPTVAVLACGMAVDYPQNSFENRKKIIAGGGAVITELLPDTECRPEYFRHRNRIISGLTYGTVVIGANNKSGSMLTARHAYEQDRDLFFTMPPDTLDPSFSNIIKYLRDGAYPVYDCYDILNEYYEAHKDKLDDTFLDKNKLSSFATLSEQALSEINHSSAEPEKVSVTKSDNKTDSGIVSASAKVFEKKPYIRKEKKSVPPEQRFVIKAGGDPSLELDYAYVTPDTFLKRIVPKEKQQTLYAKSSNSVIGVKEAVTENSATEEITETVSDFAAEKVSDNMLAVEILSILSKENGASLDKLLSVTEADFGELTEALADLEIDGTIKCGPGNVYFIS